MTIDNRVHNVRGTYLKPEEKAAIEKAGSLWGDLCALVGDDTTRNADLAELIVHIHAIQHAVMAQAAARAYPDEFRMLGKTIGAISGVAGTD